MLGDKLFKKYCDENVAMEIETWLSAIKVSSIRSTQVKGPFLPQAKPRRRGDPAFMFVGDNCSRRIEPEANTTQKVLVSHPNRTLAAGETVLCCQFFFLPKELIILKPHTKALSMVPVISLLFLWLILIL